jgi:hypothetical protein
LDQTRRINPTRIHAGEFFVLHVGPNYLKWTRSHVIFPRLLKIHIDCREPPCDSPYIARAH